MVAMQRPGTAMRPGPITRRCSILDTVPAPVYVETATASKEYSDMHDG